MLPLSGIVDTAQDTPPAVMGHTKRRRGSAVSRCYVTRRMLHVDVIRRASGKAAGVHIIDKIAAIVGYQYSELTFRAGGFLGQFIDKALLRLALDFV